MRVFNAFLIVFASVILFLLPLTTAIYDFRTDERTDVFSSTTGVGVTNANVTLIDDLYDDDTSTVDIDSSDATDSPLANTYNGTTQVLNITGLSANTTRTLNVTYDFDTLTAFDSINTLLDRLPFLWMLCVIAFAPAALAAIFLNRA